MGSCHAQNMVASHQNRPQLTVYANCQSRISERICLQVVFACGRGVKGIYLLDKYGLVIVCVIGVWCHMSCAKYGYMKSG